MITTIQSILVTTPGKLAINSCAFAIVAASTILSMGILSASTSNQINGVLLLVRTWKSITYVIPDRSAKKAGPFLNESNLFSQSMQIDGTQFNSVDFLYELGCLSAYF